MRNLKKTDIPTVFIIEDDAAISQAITILLKSVGLLVENYSSPFSFLDEFDKHRQGCILLDIRMPDMNGLDLYEKLKSSQCTLPVIFLTGYGDIAMAVRAMKAGAYDFIAKPFNSHALLEQVQRALTLTTVATTKTKVLECLNNLTMRENEVLDYLVEGKTNKEIAHGLGISLSTVELHRSNLMRKMEVKSLAELIKNYLLVN